MPTNPSPRLIMYYQPLPYQFLCTTGNSFTLMYLHYVWIISSRNKNIQVPDTVEIVLEIRLTVRIYQTFSEIILRELSRQVFNTTEPPHDKTNKIACAPSEDSDQPSLIRVFAVRMKKSLGPKLPIKLTAKTLSFAGRTCHFVA